jgi:D-cysteine desulfhydrase/L-cysteate sulfo-lyase
MSDDRGEREALVTRVADDLRAAGRRPYVIGVGGTGLVGAVGQVLAGQELASGAAVHGFVPDELVLPLATGGTQAGVLVGLRSAGASTMVRGFTVARPGSELRPAIESTVSALGDLPGLPTVPGVEILLDDGQLGPGYGRPTESAEEASRLLGRTEGILVDPIYTAKALAGLIALAATGALSGRRAVFWHAGGTPGLFEPPG